MFRKTLVAVMLSFLLTGVAFGQPDDGIRVRIINLVKGAQALQVFANGAPLGAPVASIEATSYVTLPVADHVITYAVDGETASDHVSAGTVEGVAGRDYAILLMDEVDGSGVRFDVIDETEARSALDGETQAPLLFVHDLANAPSVTLWVNGDPVLENLAYGDFVIAGLPAGEVEEVLLTAADDHADVLLQPPFFTQFQPDVGWTLALFGEFPGEPRLDYRLLPIPEFLGVVTITPQGDLEVGSAVEGTIATGERAAYRLSLAQDAVLNILMSAPDHSAVDAYVRIRDVSGNLLAENDELSYEDDVLDAGFNALALPAGDYIIEAGSFRDADAGDFQLKVELPATT